MNSELQKIMERRRQKAERRQPEVDAAHQQQTLSPTPNTDEDGPITNSPELDAIMRRRRMMADGRSPLSSDVHGAVALQPPLSEELEVPDIHSASGKTAASKLVDDADDSLQSNSLEEASRYGTGSIEASEEEASPRSRPSQGRRRASAVDVEGQRKSARNEQAARRNKSMSYASTGEFSGGAGTQSMRKSRKKTVTSDDGSWEVDKPTHGRNKSGDSASNSMASAETRPNKSKGTNDTTGSPPKAPRLDERKQSLDNGDELTMSAEGGRRRRSLMVKPTSEKRVKEGRRRASVAEISVDSKEQLQRQSGSGPPIGIPPRALKSKGSNLSAESEPTSAKEPEFPQTPEFQKAIHQQGWPQDSPTPRTKDYVPQSPQLSTNSQISGSVASRAEDSSVRSNGSKSQVGSQGGDSAVLKTPETPLKLRKFDAFGVASLLDGGRNDAGDNSEEQSQASNDVSEPSNRQAQQQEFEGLMTSLHQTPVDGLPSLPDYEDSTADVDDGQKQNLQATSNWDWGTTDPFVTSSSVEAFNPDASTTDFATDFAMFSAFPSTFDDTSANDAPKPEQDYEPPETTTFPSFDAPVEEEFDSSPLENPPKRPKPRVSLVKKNVFTDSFQTNPIVNPLTGHAIFCKEKGGDFFLHEIDLTRDCVQVVGTSILTNELQRKVATKYGTAPHGVDSVVKISCGVHKSHGQLRVRVGAVVDLNVLDGRGIRRVIAIWQWGYGASQLVLLQSVLSPPSGSEFTYQPETLQLEDGLVFIAGASSKGPCIFLCKPTVRETWSANFVASSGKISTMTTTSTANHSSPYLAIALTNGSLSVWTYEAAISTAASRKETFRKLLFPLCRLEGFGSGTAEEPKDVGFCTHLEWLRSQSPISSLLVLAASYQGGLAVFHVSLPVIVDDSREGNYRSIPPPSVSTQLSQTVTIRPLVASRWKSQREKTSVTWLNLGPHANPCVVILLHKTTGGDAARIALGAINLQIQGQDDPAKKRLVPFRILSSIEWPAESGSDPQGLLCCNSLKSVVYHTNSAIVALAPSLSRTAPDAFFMSLSYPVSSVPPGLDSSGDVLLLDSESDKDGVLHCFTVLHCNRRPSEVEAGMLDWSPPVRRHWLCRTLVGDSKAALPDSMKGDRAEAEPGDEGVVSGGSISEVVCELLDDRLAGLVPCRLVRYKNPSFCAVLFKFALGNPTDFSDDPVAIAIVDTTAKASHGVVMVLEGRDIVFLPRLHNDASVHALVLSRDGSRFSVLQCEFQTGNHSMANWVTSCQFRPILGVEPNDDFIECRRIVPLLTGSKIRLVVLGTKVSNGLECVISGLLAEFDAPHTSAMPKLIPNATKGPIFWMKKGEGIVSADALPGGKDGIGRLAFATSQRSMILSGTLEILAETDSLCGCRFAPIGSSVVAFCSLDAKIRYLCCLGGKFSSGVLATLPTTMPGYHSNCLMALRPDRFLYSHLHSGTRLMEQGDNPDAFLLPSALSKPALLLEPMVANSISEWTAQDGSHMLRVVVERFGRKVSSLSHGDDEGIGNLGSGVTAQVLEALAHYGFSHVASWLLTGTTKFERSATSKLLPPWLPVSAKAKATMCADAHLHLIANGDQFFSEYVKSPDHNMASTLPRPSDPSTYLTYDFALDALQGGRGIDTLKMLDILGTETSDCALLQISLALQIDPFVDVSKILNDLSGFDDRGLGRSSTLPAVSTSLAALALDMKSRKAQGGTPVMREDRSLRWMRPLAPSLQRGRKSGRIRQRILGTSALEKAGGGSKAASPPLDDVWAAPYNESRHIWNEGPRKEKESLLSLERLEDWMGRRRPALLGKEGANAALERGEKTLADILKMDEESFGDQSDETSLKTGWAEGIGEGRTDEENLSAYFRMSEGEDEDSPWRTEGLLDLTRHQNRGIVVGREDTINLQPTSSSVDEGEPGKVKMLYDLVFDEAVQSEPTGLAISARRGGSLDVGLLHGSDHVSRQKCSLEFWYRLPLAEKVTDEVVLARRTMGPSADDLSKVCFAGDKDSVLWELVVLKSGELDLRTCAGSSLKSSHNQGNTGGSSWVDDEEDEDPSYLVSWEREDGIGGWNHVCVVFNSRNQESTTDCLVSIHMKGKKVASETLSVAPTGFELDDLNELLMKSHLVFGVNPPLNFRMTELRVWSCERSEDDIKMFMYEYLKPAETRKRFKVKIKHKRGLALPPGKAQGKGFLSPPKDSGGLLAPPKDSSGGLLAPPKDSGGGLLAPPKDSGGGGLLAPPKDSGGGGLLAPPKDSSGGLLAPPKGSSGGLLAPPKDNGSSLAPLKDSGGISTPPNDSLGLLAAPKDSSALPVPAEDSSDPVPNPESPAQRSYLSRSKSMDHVSSPDTPTFDNSFGKSFDAPQVTEKRRKSTGGDAESLPTNHATLYDRATSLSTHVRTSAAAALIRGPPATRHFGGNRGGLPDFQGMNRVGIGSISICGSEKTVVWRDDRKARGLTYPIGASGAIVSDQMDANGSEFLCCFLAKDKRMVVFELSTKTVIVELQMTTKLNFWRYLPPEASEDTLCFMLITPVGGFHWMPLDESPRPRQVWKRGTDLQGKKIVSYEEGGTNGLTDAGILSKVGLILVTSSAGGGRLECWVIPIAGDSQALCASIDVLGACLSKPPYAQSGAFLPFMATAVQSETGIAIFVAVIAEPQPGSLSIDDFVASAVIDETGLEGSNYEPPTLAMGTWPEVICCSLGNYICAVVRRKGLVCVYELTDTDMLMVVRESLGHYVVDAAIRLSRQNEPEIVLLLSDLKNPKDGRVVTILLPE